MSIEIYFLRFSLKSISLTVLNSIYLIKILMSNLFLQSLILLSKILY